MNIIFVINKLYIPIFKICLRSVIANNSNVKVHVIHESLSDKDILKIKKEFTKTTTGIDFYKVPDSLQERIKENIDGYNNYNHHVMFKIFSAGILKHLDRALFLDADMIIKKDISEVYNEDLSRHYFAAVKLNSDHIKKMPFINKNKYSCNGFLLMNLKKIRDEKLEETFLKKIKEYKDKLIYPDQDIIQLSTYKIKMLDSTFNCRVEKINKFNKRRDARKEDLFNIYISSHVLHFAGYPKPNIFNLYKYPIAYLYFLKYVKLPYIIKLAMIGINNILITYKTKA